MSLWRLYKMAMTDEEIKNLPPPPGWKPKIQPGIGYTTESLACQEQPNPAAARAIEQATKRITKSLVNPAQEASEVIVGLNNDDIQQGSSITQKSRIFDGDSARTANLFDYLDSICSYNQKAVARLNKLRTMVFGVSLGYCKEIPDFGMRGEILDLARPNRQEKHQAPPQQLPANGQQPPAPQQEQEAQA
jgi:hypothetical protein